MTTRTQSWMVDNHLSRTGWIWRGPSSPAHRVPVAEPAPASRCGAEHTAWRRLRRWQEAGVWEKLHRAVLEKLSEEQICNWSRASIDAVSVRVKGCELTGLNPTERGKSGTKYHLLTDANGLPLCVLASAANTHDSKLFEPLLETKLARAPGSVLPQAQEVARRQGLRLPEVPTLSAPAGIKVRIAGRAVEDRTHLSRHRWVVERTISGVLRFMRLGLRYDRTEATLLPLLLLAVTFIHLRRLR
ncbi:IS5 family transposase [Kocuria sp. CPCC 205300]|uniref:IS5 family transposase n=1 Tax=Kocuria sabuli TaxID=3071448 RepID=UPI0036DE212A